MIISIEGESCFISGEFLFEARIDVELDLDPDPETCSHSFETTDIEPTWIGSDDSNFVTSLSAEPLRSIVAACASRWIDENEERVLEDALREHDRLADGVVFERQYETWEIS